MFRWELFIVYLHAVDMMYEILSAPCWYSPDVFDTFESRFVTHL